MLPAARAVEQEYLRPEVREGKGCLHVGVVRDCDRSDPELVQQLEVEIFVVLVHEVVV